MPDLATPVISQNRPTKLSEIDRFRLENVSLKLMNIGHQLDRLSEERRKLSATFDAIRSEYVNTYGVDVAVTRIDGEGNFHGPLLTAQAPEGTRGA